jgi:hypothetical protein
MRAGTMMLGVGLLATGLAGGAAAQPLPPGPLLPPRPAPNAPPPSRGLCTEAQPCRSAVNEAFYYTPSGDKRYLTRR